MQLQEKLCLSFQSYMAADCCFDCLSVNDKKCCPMGTARKGIFTAEKVTPRFRLQFLEDRGGNRGNTTTAMSRQKSKYRMSEMNTPSRSETFITLHLAPKLNGTNVRKRVCYQDQIIFNLFTPFPETPQFSCRTGRLCVIKVMIT